jgi:hypothetical protein
MIAIRNAFRCLLIVVSLSGTAQAAQYYCDSHVSGTTSQRGGDVLINQFAGSGWLTLCSMASAQNGVPPDQCKSVYSTLLAAELAGKRVRLWFNDNLTCSTQPAWTYATGWYFGPMLLD